MQNSEPNAASAAALRFRLEDLGAGDLLRVNGDTALCLKALGLYEKSQEGMAEAGLTGNCGFLLGNPRDPAKYLEPHEEFPSFWEWPGEHECAQRHNMVHVRVDQGALGHMRKKPTTLLTNMTALAELEGIWGRKFSNIFETG